MTIHIEDLNFECILGILDFERVSTQNVIINVTIDYVYNDTYINYAELSDFIKSQMIKEKFLLIEDALSHLSTKLKENFPLIDTLHLKITKPSILPDCMVSVSDSFSFVP